MISLPKTIDHMTYNRREKDMHDWQQPEEPFKYVIERFTKVGDYVLDPMAGSGTVLKVCKDLKRKCIGIDQDKECVEIMRGRIQK
jgi:DNA modification methylase